MKAVVHEALGHVFGHHAASVFEVAQVQDALVGHMPAVAGVQRGVVGAEALADVVGRQNRRFGRVLEALGAHHAAVHPADGQHSGIAQRRCGHRAHAVDRQAARGVAWQVGHQVFHHAHRAHAGAAAAVRDAEGFVQVQVAHVTAKLSRRGHTHQGVHVGAVHIDAPAVLVHQFAKLLDLRLEHAMGAGVGDHHRGQVGAVLLTLGLQVGHVHVAVLVAFGHHHLHAHHLGAGGVGAVRAGGDQANVAVALALGAVVGLNDQETRVFALTARVGLQADALVARRLAQPVAQLLVQQLVTCQLVGWGKGVHASKLGPGDGNHLAGRVELHGAAAQRDHAAVERQVLVGQLADVAQHAGLGVVTVEHRVREEGAGAVQGFGDQRGDAFFKRRPVRQGLTLLGEHLPEQVHVVPGGGFVEREAQVLVPHHPDVHAMLHRALGQSASALGAHMEAQRVKRMLLKRCVAHVLKPGCQRCGEACHPLGNALQALRAVVHGVHAGHHRGQHLRGANVAGGFFAANVLFAGLQCQAVSRVAVCIHTHTHQAAWQRALVLVTAGHEGRVRAARAHRHAKALGGTDHDVGPVDAATVPFARRFEQGQREQISGHDVGGVLGVCFDGVPGVLAQSAGGRGVLLQHGEIVVAVQQLVPMRFAFGQHHLDAQRLCARADHLDGLRVGIARDDEAVALGLDRALGQRHGLGCRRGFVQHGGIGDGHAGQVADHGLEVHQRFHAALRNLGLVRRVGGVPGGVFEDVAQDHARGVRAVIALADVAFEQAVLLRQGLEFGQSGRFGERFGQDHGLGAGDAARNDGFDQGPA